MLLMEALILSLYLINKHTLSMGIYQFVQNKPIMSPGSFNSQQRGQTTEDNISTLTIRSKATLATQSIPRNRPPASCY